LTQFIKGSAWRHILLLGIVIGSLAIAISLQPVAQDPGYHYFADSRGLFDIPNFLNVLSNIPFLLVGLAGANFCYRNKMSGYWPAWLIFFSGVAAVSMGSGYYHWKPDNLSLLWDRLPMTLAFMGLFVALLTEYVAIRLGRALLLPVLLLGLSSVLYWYWFDDLRLYFWIQLIPLLTVPVVMVLYRPRYSHQWMLLGGLGCYILAKVTEIYDREIFVVTQQLVGGHPIKHLLAALGCFTVLLMLKKRVALK